jgi:hypothetical protein
VGGLPLWGQRLPEDFNAARAERQGRELVSELRARVPAGNHTNTGTLTLRSRRSGKSVEFPVRFTVQVTPGGWVAAFEALESPPGTPFTAFCIATPLDRPRTYHAGTPAEIGVTQPLTVEAVATNRFAGSDFWLGDLGLEFLYWPVQRLLMKDMRRGQSCNVLESRNPDAPAGGYARIVSWLDIDTGGIVFAEAFDADDRRIKEFIPKSFKKVDGEWHLQEMRIEDLRSRSRTTIRFDVGGA